MKHIIILVMFIVLLGCSGPTRDTLEQEENIDHVDLGRQETSPNEDLKSEDYYKLLWPIDCKVDINCKVKYPDVDNDGVSFNCKDPSYKGHEGTDIDITFNQMHKGIDVFSSADGIVLWVFDGKYDMCPNDQESDCINSFSENFPGMNEGYRVCTEEGDFCRGEECCCFWCFDGGNIIIIKHPNNAHFFATRYDHLRNDSIIVKQGDLVKKGQKIAEVGSSGKSTNPHLHFEVWGKTYYDPVDPWEGDCGPNFDNSLWEKII
jgi:murein DD-endopeptidase MepM/ murein hydrolase activator NlpD